LNLVDECNVIFILFNASTRKAMEDIQVNPMLSIHILDTDFYFCKFNTYGIKFGGFANREL
jgi:hypothetical protein